jgi:hypothetical protein
MMFLLILTSAPTWLLPPTNAVDLRCVAVIAVAAKPTQAKDGAYFAAVAGADAMDAAGVSREQVRDVILGHAKIVRAQKLSSSELRTCTLRMASRIKVEGDAR